MIQVFCTAPTISSSGKYYLFPLLEPFLQPAAIATDVAKTVNPQWKKHYTITADAATANVFILPMDIAWYLHTGQRQVVEEFIATAKQWQKPCWIFSGGDYGITWPDQYVQILRMSGTRSGNKGNQFVMPPFMPDPLCLAAERDIKLLDLPSKPTVGFCGQANGSQLARLKDYVRAAVKWIKQLQGNYLYDLQPFTSTTYQRYQVLQTLQQEPLVNANFLLFDQYKGGASSEEQQVQSRLRYYQNISNNAYTLCIRGAGNFSVRFYDCLASGRIPVLIDTDSMLPLENLIDWNAHILKVPAHKMTEAARLLIAFHQPFSLDQWQQLQLTNRQLWQEKLTYDGFFAHFHLLPPNQSFAHLYA